MLYSALLVVSWTAIRCVWCRLACVLRSCPLEKCLLPDVAWLSVGALASVLLCACLSTLARCAFHVPILSVTSGPSCGSGSGDASVLVGWLVQSGVISWYGLYLYVTPFELKSGYACASSECWMVVQ